MKTKKLFIVLSAIVFANYTFLFAQGTSTGLIPINDLQKNYYKNYQGGFYPNGLNSRPAKHDSAGIEISKKILPLNPQGGIDLQNGKYVFLSIGMSNTTQEFSTFKQLADGDSEKNPKLIIVDGAQGGQTATIISNASAQFWNVIEQRLQSAGVTAQQVRVCWIKEANANPQQAFPTHANQLTNELVLIASIIKQKYPNCLIAYLSSRTYGGYATTTLNPEPFAYESAFSVKWLIEKQINGDGSLTYSGANPKAPWLAWGPYLWADGLNARSDGLIWNINDFVESDRTHPSTTGRKKVADLLLNFLKTDNTARNWFLKTQTEISSENQLPTQFDLMQNFPNPFNPETAIRYKIQAAGHVILKVYDVIGNEVATLVDEEKQAGTHNYKLSIINYKLSSGVYFYRLTAISTNLESQQIFSSTKKMLLIK